MDKERNVYSKLSLLLGRWSSKNGVIVFIHGKLYIYNNKISSNLYLQFCTTHKSCNTPDQDLKSGPKTKLKDRIK